MSRARTNKAALAKEVAEQFPKEWKILTQRLRDSKKPEMPKPERDALKKKVRAFLSITHLLIGPSKKYPFIIKAGVDPDGDDLGSNILGFLPRPEATPEEKALVKMLDFEASNAGYDEYYDLVWNCPGYKELFKRQRELNKEIQKAADKYNEPGLFQELYKG